MEYVYQIKQKLGWKKLWIVNQNKMRSESLRLNHSIS